MICWIFVPVSGMIVTFRLAVLVTSAMDVAVIVTTSLSDVSLAGALYVGEEVVVPVRDPGEGVFQDTPWLPTSLITVAVIGRAVPGYISQESCGERTTLMPLVFFRTSALHDELIARRASSSELLLPLCVQPAVKPMDMMIKKIDSVFLMAGLYRTADMSIPCGNRAGRYALPANERIWPIICTTSPPELILSGLRPRCCILSALRAFIYV